MIIENFRRDAHNESWHVEITATHENKIRITIRNNFSASPVTHVFDFPVRVARGYIWKCNAASMSENEGKAENIMRLFENEDAYAWGSVRHLIFEHPKKLQAIGL